MIDKRIPIFRTIKQTIDADELSRLIIRHQQYQGKYKKAFDYYEGKHEILNRKIVDPTKPNHKCVLSYPNYICSVRNGFFSGNPITLVSQDKQMLSELNKVLDYNNFHTVFGRLDNVSSIYGHCTLVLYIDRYGEMKMKVVEPDRSFIVYDCSLDMNRVFGVIYNKYLDDATGDIVFTCDVYDKDYHYIYQGSENNLELVSTEEHYFGNVPMLEFVEKEDRMGCYENVYDVIDSLEQIVSDNLNTMDYFGNSYLLLKNLSGTDSEDIQKMKENRILLVEEDGDARFISPVIESQFVNNNFKTLHSELFLLCKTPCLADESFSSNSSGVSISYKLFSMTKSIDVKEQYFKESFDELFAMIVHVFNLRGYDYNPRDIKLTFVKSLPQDMNNLADSISKLKDTVSQRSLLSQLDFITDADVEIETFREEQEYMMKRNMEMMDTYDDYSADEGDGDEPQE